MKDPYQTLGVERTASQEEIKNAYRKLAKKFHPDLNPGNKGAEKEFKQLSAAYEIVGNPKNREKFDRGEWEENTGAEAQARAQEFRGGPFYREAQQGGERYHFHFGEGGADELFEKLFRGRGGRAHAGAQGAEGFSMPGEDENYRMEVDLKDAVLGAKRELTLPSGKRLAVQIPTGVAPGTRLRFASQGSPGYGGGPPGDVYVELAMRADPRFELQGRDLVHELPVGFDTAILGGEARVPTPEGEVLLKIPRHSSSDRKFRIPGKGIFERGEKARGDLIVRLKIELPEELDAELESAVRAWRERRMRNGRAQERSAG